MPAKVNAFIDFLAETYGSEPYWEREGGKGLPAPARSAGSEKPAGGAAQSKAARSAASIR